MLEHVTESVIRATQQMRLCRKEKKGHRKENSTIKPEIPADENQQRIKNASAMNTSKNHHMNQIKKPKGKTIN